MKIFITLVLFIAFVSTCQGKSIELYSAFGTEPNTLGDGVQEFVDQLEDISRFQVQVKTPADLGIGQAELLQNVANGTIDMAILIPNIQDRGSEKLNVEIDLYGESFPFGLQLEEYLSWHYDGGGLAILEDILKNDGDGVVTLPVIAAPGQSTGMFKGEITKARLEAISPPFKMRTFGFGQLVMQEAFPNMEFRNAVPGLSGIADILDGFETGDIEAAEFAYPQVDFDAFMSSANPNILQLGVTHYYITAWQSPVTVQYLAINKRFFNRLNEKKQRQIRLAALANTQNSHSRLLHKQGESLKDFQDAGIFIRTLPEDILIELLAATETVIENIASDNPRFNEVLNSVKSYVRTQNTWLTDSHIDRDFRYYNWNTDWTSDIKAD